MDLILYDDVIMENSDIVIPDPEIASRAFLAIPLFELDSSLLLPKLGKSIREIAKSFSSATLRQDVSCTEKIRKLLK